MDPTGVAMAVNDIHLSIPVHIGHPGPDAAPIGSPRDVLKGHKYCVHFLSHRPDWHTRIPG